MGSIVERTHSERAQVSPAPTQDEGLNLARRSITSKQGGSVGSVKLMVVDDEEISLFLSGGFAKDQTIQAFIPSVFWNIVEPLSAQTRPCLPPLTVADAFFSTGAYHSSDKELPH